VRHVSKASLIIIYNYLDMASNAGHAKQIYRLFDAQRQRDTPSKRQRNRTKRTKTNTHNSTQPNAHTGRHTATCVTDKRNDRM